MDSIPKYVFLGFVLLVIAGLAAIGLHNSSLMRPEPTLKGAGSSFVAPLMVQWADRYGQTDDGCLVGYRSVGSARGIRSILEGQVDFACSDAPMSDDELARAREGRGEIVHVPLVLGAVVPAYNLSEVNEPLRFTGPLLADIFLGKIKKWNDEAIRKLNPGVALPDRDIVVIHRLDGSGTTYIWVDYLAKVSPQWKKKVGVGTSVEWPVGIEMAGNEGVAGRVQNTPGSLGYVELAYTYRNDLAFGLVQNRENEFVKANIASITRAADSMLATIPDDLRFSLTNAPGKGSYPICGTTWALVRLRQPAGKKKQLIHFLRWATGPGQDLVRDLLYVRLPDALAARAGKVIDSLDTAE